MPRKYGGEERRGVIASVNVSAAGAGRVVYDQVREEKERHSLSSSWSPRESLGRARGEQETIEREREGERDQEG